MTVLNYNDAWDSACPVMLPLAPVTMQPIIAASMGILFPFFVFSCLMFYQWLQCNVMDGHYKSSSSSSSSRDHKTHAANASGTGRKGGCGLSCAEQGGGGRGGEGDAGSTNSNNVVWVALGQDKRGQYSATVNEYPGNLFLGTTASASVPSRGWIQGGPQQWWGGATRGGGGGGGGWW